MTVQLWIGQEFDTSHERKALHTFLNDMQARFGQGDDLFLVLANYFIGGHQVDLTVLKRDAIIVIELKECADPIRAAENGDWITTSGGKVVGTGAQNPFEQAKSYRFSWVDFLRDNQDRFLPSGKARSMDFLHVSAFVAISPSLHPESQNKIPHSPWFRLVGLDQLVEVVYQQTSRELNISNQELTSLVADVLDLRQVVDVSFVEELVDHWAQYCQTLLANHRDWTGMPPRLYISPEVMNVAPAGVVPYRRWPDDLPNFSRQITDQTTPLSISEFSSLVPVGKSELDEGIDLLQLVDECRRPIVLLGDPGMGKSVALERLALKYAERYVEDGGYVPVLVRLRQYNSQKRDLRYLVRVAIQGGDLSLGEQRVEEILRTENLLLLFDGLDEALRDSDVVPEIETFVREYPQHKYVISCRTKAYEQIKAGIQGCDQVNVVRLKPEEAAILWNSAAGEVGLVEFSDLPETIQDMLRTPLLLHLSPKAVEAYSAEITTRSQFVDSIVRELMRTLGTPTEDVAERCLFRVALEMQGDGKYVIARDEVFDVVAEYLEGESIAYRQEIATQVLKHPMLVTPEWDILSFWHPDLQEYFAARGLQDAVLRQGSVESVLRYLGAGEFDRWYDILVYLAGLLGQREVTKLIDYLLDFNHQDLALLCTLQARSLQDGMIETVVEGTLKYLETLASERVEESSNEQLAVELFLLLDAAELPSRIGMISYGLILAVEQFECRAFLELELRSMLGSQEELQRLIGLYLLNLLAKRGITFSDDLVDTVGNLFTSVLGGTRASAGTLWMVTRVFPKIANREQDFPLWEKILFSKEWAKLGHLMATLALLDTEGDGALRLLRSALDHEDPQVRLVAVRGMAKHRQKSDLLRMVYDLNPIIAHEATYLISSGSYGLGQDLDATPGLYKLMIENLIAPLAGKIPHTMLSEQFSDLRFLTGPLDYLVRPFEHEERLEDLVYTIMVEGLHLCYGDSSAAIVALIWGVALADPSPKQLGFRSDLETAKEHLGQVKITEEGQLYVWGSPVGKVYTEIVTQEGRLSLELSGELLTEEHTDYIRSWTDYEATRELAAAVLTGRWRAD